jgi:hypothetical protein
MEPTTSETTLPSDAELGARLPWYTAARRELWAHLPAWMFFVYASLLLNTQLTNFVPARNDLAYTIIFPLSVFVTYQVVRFTHGKASLRLLVTSLVLAFGLPTLTFFVHTPAPIDPKTLLRWYEWSNFAWAALLVWQLWKHERTHVALFFGVAFVYGAALENGGIVLDFFHEENLADTMVKPFVAPVATMVGWSVVLSMATFVTWGLRKRLGWLKRSALLSALALGSFATMLDLQIDPVATFVGCWVWHASLPEWFHGVPLVNFVAWMCALVPFAYVLFRLQELRGIADGAKWSRGDLLALLRWSPAGLVIAALAFISITLVLEGPNGPSWTLLNVFSAKVLAVALG